MKTKRIIAFIMALVITFSLFAFYGPGSIRTSAQSDLLTYANFSVKDNNGNAKGPGGLYKPQKDNTILYWGSSELQAKDQTLKFTGTLTSPSDNYDKTQFMVSLRAENMLNPWDTMTAYWILLDNSCVIVRDGKGNTLFQTDDDRFSNVPGYSDTRYMLISLIDWCEVNAEGTAAGGTRKSFYNRSHDYEFSAVNEEGGVRLIAKIDGMTILNWLDTANTVDAAGGFSVRTEDVYALDISGMTFAGDDGQTVNLLTEENIGKLDSNTASFGGYASASQWTMPLMNGGMGEIYADTALLDATVELDLRVDNPFQSESWILNLFLRDPTPNAFPWDNQSEFYQVTVLKDQMQFYRKLASGTELIDTLYFGIGSGEEWKYWSTAHHLKLTASTSKDGDVRFSVYLDHSSTELMNAGGSAGVTDSSRKITTAGGIGIWGNNYIERNADTGIYSYAQSVYVNNLTATGSALPPEEPNDTETMYDLLKGNYMLDYYFGSSYQGESNTIAIGPHGNTGTISYDEKNILNQYIDLTLSNTGADGWHNMVYLRDQAPGYAAWEKENLGEGATATFYNLVFSGEKEVALYAYVDGSPTLLSQKNLEGISFLDQNQVSLRIECEDNEAGNPVIRIFDAAGSLLFRYEDTVKTIPNAGGFTIVSDTGAGKNTTIYRLKANVVWREPTIFEQPVDSDEEPAAVSGMQDLVENSQILSTRFPVTCTGKKIDLAGATANSGDIPRIYAEFLNDAAPQVVEMTLKYNSYQTNDNVESDWLGALILADDLPGYANWDPERTEGNGGYLFNMCKNEIMVWRVSSASSMELVTSYALPENFWDSEHTLRFETYYESGYTLIKVFVDGIYTYRMVDDSAERLTGGKGFTFLSKVSSTVTAMTANTPYVEKPSYPDFEPEEKPTTVSGMQDLVKEYQILTSKFTVDFTGSSIELGGAPSSMSGDISRIYADFLQDAGIQVLEMNLKFDSMKMPDGVDCDWLGAVMLQDQLPGFASWDTERADGAGGYWILMTADTIYVHRVLSPASVEPVTSYAVPSEFWKEAHTFRFETYTEKEYVLIKVFIDGVYTFRMVDDTDSRITGGKGFTFVSKASSKISAMQGNSPYVEKLPEFDLSQCQAVDFSELLLDTYDWGGQIRANNIGKTIFHPNGIELLEGADKNAAFIRDGAAYGNFYIDFKLNMTVTEEFLDRGIGDWIFLFTFRDSNPVYNTWDQTSKNAYGILATYDPVSNVSTLLLRRFNNSAGSMVTTELASVGGLDMMDKSSTFRVGTYNTGKGVRIAVWMDGKKIIDLEDTDENAVTQAGSFMIGQHGVVQNTSIPIVRSLLFEGLLPGEDRPSYTLGVNEPKQESAKLYPRDVYELSDLTDLPVQTESISEGQGIAAAVLLIAAIVVVAAAGAVTVILLIRKKGGKQA